MEPNPKLIFFDMEGTIFKKPFKFSKGNTQPSLWTMIAKKLGEKALKEEENTKDKWNNKQYRGYVEWMDDTIKIHQKYRLTKKIFDEVMASDEYHKGVKETFEQLEKKGYKTVLLSGGFKAQADKAQKDLKIDHAFAACEYFWDKNGELLHWNLFPSDYEGKIDFMKLIMKEYKVTPDECVFVGDGINDVYLAKEVKIGISFNGHEELQKVCTHSINQPEGQEDFTEILKFL